MNFAVLNFSIAPLDPFRDILFGELSEIGFDGFEDTEKGLLAYIPEDRFDASLIKSLRVMQNKALQVSYTTEIIVEQNWNADWESDFEPIEVTEDCYVRAPFHPSRNLPYEIVIEPKMSFGTGHHETTWLVLRQMLNIDFEGKSVLDMGTGTGVLAILASKLDAKDVLAIDVDEWAYKNAIENTTLNDAVNITVEKGGFERIKQHTFHVILANINKNVLLQHMSILSNCLEPSGILILSGFFEKDIADLRSSAEKNGLVEKTRATKNDWAVLQLMKQ